MTCVRAVRGEFVYIMQQTNYYDLHVAGCGLSFTEVYECMYNTSVLVLLVLMQY